VLLLGCDLDRPWGKRPSHIGCETRRHDHDATFITLDSVRNGDGHSELTIMTGEAQCLIARRQLDPDSRQYWLRYPFGYGASSGNQRIDEDITLAPELHAVLLLDLF
jgi:hypothetical protein